MAFSWDAARTTASEKIWAKCKGEKHNSPIYSGPRCFPSYMPQLTERLIEARDKLSPQPRHLISWHGNACDGDKRIYYIHFKLVISGNSNVKIALVVQLTGKKLF